LYCIEKLHRLPSEVGVPMWELMIAFEVSRRQVEREREAIESARHR
jgi:hypothetical protein